VKIDTVDSFEGREEDLVVISLVRSNERGRIGFLRVPNRLNVAVSRAKRLVACIGDANTLRSGEESMYGVLVEAAREAGGYVLASDVISPRRRQDRPFGAEGESNPLEGGGQPRRRRRRRRGGAVGISQPALGPDGQPLAPAAGTSATEQETGQPARRRRRRRRHGGAPQAASSAGPAPDGEQSQAGTEGAPTAGGLPSARARRRRRHRHGPRPAGAPGTDGGADTSGPSGNTGGDGPGSGPSAEPPSE
jgi:hypothetical protein